MASVHCTTAAPRLRLATKHRSGPAGAKSARSAGSSSPPASVPAVDLVDDAELALWRSTMKEAAVVCWLDLEASGAMQRPADEADAAMRAWWHRQGFTLDTSSMRAAFALMRSYLFLFLQDKATRAQAAQEGRTA